jgi:adenine/guanine phosphoribosyltransferase-like PRPP-binding protein
MAALAKAVRLVARRASSVAAPTMDLVALLRDAKTYCIAVDSFAQYLAGERIDAVAVADPDAPMLAAPLAYRLGVPLLLGFEGSEAAGGAVSGVRVRSAEEGAGREPPSVVFERVVAVGCVLGDGSASVAFRSRLRATGSRVFAHLFLAEAADLGGRKLLEEPAYSLVQL